MPYTYGDPIDIFTDCASAKATTGLRVVVDSGSKTRWTILRSCNLVPIRKPLEAYVCCVYAEWVGHVASHRPYSKFSGAILVERSQYQTPYRTLSSLQ